MTIEKTKDFYREFDDLCDCAYCRNYVKEIKKSYPELASYLDNNGVNIEKPFETMPGESDGGCIEYLGVQYILIGDKKDFKKEKCGEVTIDLTESYPDPDLDCEYYVIEIHPIRLKWTIEEEI